MKNILDRINFAMVKAFLTFVMQLATEKDAVNADTVDEMVAFNNCFCFFCVSFSFEKLQSIIFCYTVFVLCMLLQNSFEGFMVSLDNKSPCIIQSMFGECESLITMNI